MEFGLEAELSMFNLKENFLGRFSIFVSLKKIHFHYTLQIFIVRLKLRLSGNHNFDTKTVNFLNSEFLSWYLLFSFVEEFLTFFPVFVGNTVYFLQKKKWSWNGDLIETIRRMTSERTGHVNLMFCAHKWSKRGKKELEE